VIAKLTKVRKKLHILDSFRDLALQTQNQLQPIVARAQTKRINKSVYLSFGGFFLNSSIYRLKSVLSFIG
jgi:hypothetical protein